jgi:hypothetical protein
VSEIRRVKELLAKAYRSVQGDVVEVPRTAQVIQWVSFANDYIAAASLIDEYAHHRLWLPRMQMTGQAVESALKACVVSAGLKVPVQHDLGALCDLAVSLGFELSDPDLAAVVHLTHLYHEDVATGTRYKTRYPTLHTEALGGAVPANSVYVSIVRTLSVQATGRG